MHKDKKRRLRRPLQVPAGRGFSGFGPYGCGWCLVAIFLRKRDSVFFFGGGAKICND